MINIRYFAAARAARGAERETLDFAGPLADLLAQLGAKHTQITAGGMTLAQIFERCTFLINGKRAETTADLREGDQLDVLPPFAGG